MPSGELLFKRIIHPNGAGIHRGYGSSAAAIASLSGNNDAHGNGDGTTLVNLTLMSA